MTNANDIARALCVASSLRERSILLGDDGKHLAADALAIERIVNKCTECSEVLSDIREDKIKQISDYEECEGIMGNFGGSASAKRTEPWK